MTYLAELRAHWRPLLAATIGMGSGMSVVGTVTSTIAPTLIHDAGWSKAEFAMVGGVAFVTSFSLPFIGRLADVLGVRATAMIGQIAAPIIYLLFSMLGSNLWAYVTIFTVHSLLCVTTTATVYTRLPVQYVRHARGLALAIVASGPAIAGIFLAPALNAIVEAHGWRAGYHAVAIFSIVAGIATFFLIPSSAHPRRAGATGTGSPVKRKAREDYPLIFRTPAFWILLTVMFLCNLPATIMLVQLKLLMLDNGVSGKNVSIMLSALSAGMLTGRLATGVALDRFAPQLVSFVTLGLPSIGLFVIASRFDAIPVLTLAVFCLGLSFGAEGDIVGFLVARSFPVEIYSSVMGFLTCAMSLSAASGAALLSFTLARTGGYNAYLVIAGTAVLIGASLIFLIDSTGRSRASDRFLLRVSDNGKRSLS